MLVYKYEALALELEQDHKEVLLLALATEPDDLKKKPELTATFGPNCATWPNTLMENP